MFRRTQRSLALLSLTAVLFLVVPDPARAAGVGDWQIPVLLSAKAWQWVARLWPGGDGHACARKPTVVRGKDGFKIGPDGSSSDPPTGSTFEETIEEGSMIDPDGHR